jgi:hypothetical protein
MKNDEAKQRAKNYMSLKGALEPNQIKCYCGHTSYCDCSPLEEPTQELELKDFESSSILDVLNMGNVTYLSNGDVLYNPNLLFIKRDDKWFIKTELPKQETLEAAAEKYARKQCDDMYDNQGLTGASWGWETSLDFIAGAKWQQKRMYSEEEFLCFSEWVSSEDWVYLPSKGYWVNEEQEELEQKFTTKQLFEQFKKK